MWRRRCGSGVGCGYDAGVTKQATGLLSLPKQPGVTCCCCLLWPCRCPQDYLGNTALRVAAAKGHLDSVKV